MAFAFKKELIKFGDEDTHAGCLRMQPVITTRVYFFTSSFATHHAIFTDEILGFATAAVGVLFQVFICVFFVVYGI